MQNHKADKHRKRRRRDKERQAQHRNIKLKGLHINKRDQWATGADLGRPSATQIAEGCFDESSLNTGEDSLVLKDSVVGRCSIHCFRNHSFFGVKHKIDNSENQKPKAYKIRIKQKPKQTNTKTPPHEKKRTPDMGVRPGAQEE
ncbi:hypothetical protein FSP39_025267 [Pinctada imbricata]|uniref:Uncharacterized protein n=1 Tax=Pinctada imbricata TaxID=66713 RepID=A0AA88YPJ4_PINIB|nr:hypothetical protein FSP39_025267 [Pinctada imbricata]